MQRFLWPLLSALLVAASLIFFAHPVVLLLAITNLLAALFFLLTECSAGSVTESTTGSQREQDAPETEAKEAPHTTEESAKEESLARAEFKKAKETLATHFHSKSSAAPIALRHSPKAASQSQALGLNPQLIREMMDKATCVPQGDCSVLYYKNYRLFLRHEDSGDTLLEIQRDDTLSAQRNVIPKPSRPRRNQGVRTARAKDKTTESRNCTIPPRPIPGDKNAYLALLSDFGFRIVRGSKHYKITHPHRPGVVSALPTTPSSQRWIANSISSIRHQFNIDLRRWDIDQATAPLSAPSNSQTEEAPRTA